MDHVGIDVHTKERQIYVLAEGARNRYPMPAGKADTSRALPTGQIMCSLR
jgi:hypothetical protein